MPFTIDVHHHILPDFFWRETNGQHGLVGGIAPAPWSRETTLSFMDDAEIDVAVTSISTPGVHMGDDARARALARRCNELSAELVQARPDRFGGFACLPLPDLDGSLGELAYALDVLGLDGVVLFSNARGIYLGDSRFDALFQELERRRAVVFLHPTASPDPTAHALGLPDSLIDFVADTTRAIAKLHYSDTFARTPNVKYIISHAGGTIPYLATRFDVVDQMGVIPDQAHRGPVADTLRRLYWDTALSWHDPVIEMLRSVVGIDHVVYGSDFPYLRRDLAIAGRRQLAQSEALSAAERKHVLGGTAASLLPRFAARAAARTEPAAARSTAGRASNDRLVTHPLEPADAAIMVALRTMAKPAKGMARGIAAREPFDALMENVQPRNDVTFEADTVGGISGLWAVPAQARSGAAILHLHGGWFNLGTAKAYRHLVGQIAARAGAKAFIPDYRLAPEHPFPAAPEDVLACYRGLAQAGIERIAITGDSAGGNLALVLASRVTAGDFAAQAALVAVAVMSPITDLSLSGETYETRAEADPFFTRPQVAELVHAYLGSADPRHPLASALHARCSALPALRIDVGDDEVLLDDSRRYFARAVAAGVDARLDVWMGMPHGFPSNIGTVNASARALDAIGMFLADKIRMVV